MRPIFQAPIAKLFLNLAQASEKRFSSGQTSCEKVVHIPKRFFEPKLNFGIRSWLVSAFRLDSSGLPSKAASTQEQGAGLMPV
jgi:hypothetical protein